MTMVTRPTLERRPLRGAKPDAGRNVFRSCQRYRLDLPIRIIAMREEGPRIVEGRATDICEGGVLVYAGIELRSGDKVTLEFTPPYSSTPVRAPGVVRHRRGYNYGVEFPSETPHEQDQSTKFRNLLQIAAGDIAH
jgi:hypothetical protein